MMTVRLPLADDLHVHLRQGTLMEEVVPLIRAGGVGRCLVMPNTKPPVAFTDDALRYRDVLRECAPDIEFLMTLYLTPELTPAEVRRAHEAGIAAVKLYPKGVTTNSASGVESLQDYRDVFVAMEECDLVLSIHGEMPACPERGIDVMTAEACFLPELEALVAAHPSLRIVLEHVSTAAAVECVDRLGKRVAATITPHHLDLIADDWRDQIHNFCKPVAKTREDRDALWTIIRSGHPQFFFGSDSAPHPRKAKECGGGCAGVFTTPLVLAYLADSFERNDALDRLADFVGLFGRTFYGLPATDREVTLVKEPQTVPDTYGDVVPYRAGQQCGWTIQ